MNSKTEPLWLSFLLQIGQPISNFYSIVKDTGILFIQMLRLLFHFPWRVREIFRQICQIGLNSIPIITIATAFAGLVITNEIAFHMKEALHSVSMVPGFTGQFIVRELAIAIPALLVIAKVGAAITAEIGSMKVTEQIDALKVLQINPVSYLVFPRWVASIFSLIILTFISVAITFFFAILVAMYKFNFGFQEYINAVKLHVSSLDAVCALVKSSVFGAIIPIISCAYGFNTKGGAQGVGAATTNAVVTSTITVIILDFIITYIFTRL